MRPWADRPTDRLIRPQRTGKVISARGGADDRIAGCTIGVQNNKNYGCPRRALTPRYIAGRQKRSAYEVLMSACPAPPDRPGRLAVAARNDLDLAGAVVTSRECKRAGVVEVRTVPPPPTDPAGSRSRLAVTSTLREPLLCEPRVRTSGSRCSANYPAPWRSRLAVTSTLREPLLCEPRVQASGSC